MSRGAGGERREGRKRRRWDEDVPHTYVVPHPTPPASEPPPPSTPFKGGKDGEQSNGSADESAIQGSKLPRARVNTPRPHPTSESPNPPPSTPNPPFEQMASTSRRPTGQRSRNGHLPSNETHHTREHDKGSQRRGQSRSRGLREADNDDGKDNDIHQAHVVPQNPQSTRQTAYNFEATDTSNPNATSARPTEPVGTLNGPLNESNENEGKGKKGEKGENDDGGDENVRHAYIVPSPTPPASRLPPSTPLEGEKEKGQQLSGRTDEAATHQIEPPRQKSRTTPPKRMPDDGRSSREGQGVAIGHKQAGKARDEPAIEVERKPIEGEEGQSREPGRLTTATNTNENAPPPPPPPAPDHPERLHHDDSAKTSKTAARIRADAQHDPGGETRAPEAKPLSVRLEGEWNRHTSLHVEAPALASPSINPLA
ncbi:hypothetical protein PAXINDRAFT_15813 [Paxillus involutus ATCC 200175]|uniref:Uncharacterized protein n=1 Tax=Paxillus involutus ATCC 200175 TaxID=664439 RepID=A0A0C9TVD1_PAXIN|nr:hypothetical protein PAXINDRAFT_15813 [Paxillus involutus ATCC 200175]